MNLENIQNTGLAAVHRAAAEIRPRLGKIGTPGRKGPLDLVTEADTESEKAIIRTIRSRFPDHEILAEESGLSKGSASCTWIIDPLDGTTNFAHGVPLFSISIAFAHEGEIKAGFVLNPESGELFSAVKGRGAELNGRKIRVTDTSEVSDSLLVTGFPYNFKEILEPLMTRFTNCLSASRGVRRLGSAALDLCFVACGRFDAFWEQNLKPWDTAAGFLIAEEAGARVTDFSNNRFDVERAEILATNGNIHNEMLSLLELEKTI